jgi:hypothetical protein
MNKPSGTNFDQRDTNGEVRQSEVVLRFSGAIDIDVTEACGHSFGYFAWVGARLLS